MYRRISYHFIRGRRENCTTKKEVRSSSETWILIAETTLLHILCHGKTVFSDLLTIKGGKHEVASKRQTLLIQQHNVISRNTYILSGRGVET